MAQTRSYAQETCAETLAGTVERVTFHNADTGFAVLKVKARGKRDLITVIGHAATISAGEFVTASGTWVNDRSHGVQFKAQVLKPTAPTTSEGIERYLASGQMRGIGPAMAKRIVAAFGDATFDIIEATPVRADDSPLTVAYEDPVLRAEGLASDRLGDAMDFFELNDNEAHVAFCSCHVGSSFEARFAASRVRALIKEASPPSERRTGLRALFSAFFGR